jgi:DNA-binding MarR family transcriptional regulator
MPTRKTPATRAGAAPAAGGPRLDEVLGYQLARASISTTSIFVRVVGGPLELRPVEYTILSLIRESPGLSLARIAQALAVTAPNITVWISHLEKRGLVAREASSTDRRAQVLSLTADGEAIALAATQRLVEAERAAFGHLSRGEFTLLTELLEKVAAARSK